MTQKEQVNYQDEIWIGVVGFEDRYEVSTLGRARSLSVPHKIRGGGFYMTKGRILKPVLSKWGYYYITCAREGVDKKFMIHKLMAEAFLPNPENKPEVNHIDGNKLNNRLENLEWVTKSENALHAHRLGLSKSPGLRGEDAGSSKVTEKIVDDIRSNYVPKKTTQKFFAEKYGIAITTVSAIIRRVTWNHI